MHYESYIDQLVKDPEGIPVYVRASLDDLRKYDKEGRWWMYDSELDNLWVLAKNAVADGHMTKDAWQVIYKKYWEHQEIVWKKEEADGEISRSFFCRMFDSS